MRRLILIQSLLLSFFWTLARVASICLRVETAMASYGLRAQKPIGSSAWIETERDNVRQLVDQDMEDVVYPAQNELQWLNEHMDDIFGRSQLYGFITHTVSRLTTIATSPKSSRHPAGCAARRLVLPAASSLTRRKLHAPYVFCLLIALRTNCVSALDRHLLVRAQCAKQPCTPEPIQSSHRKACSCWRKGQVGVARASTTTDTAVSVSGTNSANSKYQS